MEYSKSFFGSTVIDSSDSEEIDKDEKIELEYYETHNVQAKTKRIYGIEVLKRNIKNDELNIIEAKVINNISEKEHTISKLLEILMVNKVTPISVDDVISDISVLD